MKKIILTIFLSIFYSVAINAQTLDSIRIKLVLNIDDLKTQKNKVQIFVSDVPFGGLEFFRPDMLQLDTAVSKTVEFVFKPNNLYTYIYINAVDPRGFLSKYTVLDNIYTVKSGSNLTCSIQSNKYVFSGTGAKPLEVQNHLRELQASPLENQNFMNLLGMNRFEEAYKLYDTILDSTLTAQLLVLESARHNLDEMLYHAYIANCYGWRYNGLLRDLSNEAQGSHKREIYRSFISSRYTSKSSGSKLSMVKGNLVNSPVYTSYLLEEMLLKERVKLNNYDDHLSKESLFKLINNIKKEPQQLLRDKLFALLVTRLKRNPNLTEYLTTCLSLTKEPKYRKIISEEISIKAIGKPFREFILKDSLDKIYTLKDFKDKVVFVDFWYTGCANCIILTEAMTPVYNHFRLNKDVVFLNISVDKDKIQWRKSIKGGKYVHDGSLSLYTNGEGEDHDLIDHYKIRAYPHFQLVKDGVLFSAMPPDPRTGRPDPGEDISKGAAQLIALIDEALSKLAAK